MKRHLIWAVVLGVACSGTCGDDDKDERQPPVLTTNAAEAILDQDGTIADTGRASFDVPVSQGDHLEVQVTSQAFDPILEVTPPGGGTLTNDDWQGSRNESRLSVVAAEAGVMKVTVGRVGTATGAFHVSVRRAGTQGAAPSLASTPLLPAGGMREGDLQAGDATLADGRFNEWVLVSGADAGQLQLRIEARGDVVPLAIVMDPNGAALQGTGGVYTISHPGPHRVQLIAPTAGQNASYRMSLQASQQVVTPTLSRSHHQLPTQTTGTAIQLGQTLSGTLAPGASLPTGEPVQVYLLDGRAGQHVQFEMRSTAFDTYLMVVGPSGRYWENDDTGGTTNSAVDVDLPADGSYRIVATAYRAGMAGAFELKASETHDATPAVANTAPTGAEAVTRSGELAQGDQTLQTGEFRDTYNFTWPANATIDLSLTSSAFDTYLIVRPPSGDQQDNDDAEEGNTNSRLQVQTQTAGAYQVIVTSYQPNETGAYELTVTPSGGGAAPTPAQTPTAAGSRTIDGELAQGDRQLQSGELADSHTLTLTSGQTVHLEARSTAFDSYLILREPGGEQHDNDDGPGGGTNAALDFTAPATGEYTVMVTSYRAGEQGAYQLIIGGEGGGTPTTPTTPVAGGDPTPATGDAISGALAQGDSTLQSGELTDAYSRSFDAGQSVQIRLASTAFDPYLIVRTPSGRQIDNDDLTPSTRNAGVDIPAAESGDYRITVTSYRPGETGAYELTFGAGQAIPRPNAANGEGGRVFGLFAGITDYPDGVGDLPECANDAIKLAEALRSAGLLDESRQILLTDSQASRANVRNGLRRLAGEMGPEDVFVFFYSGHGGQTQSSNDAREIDGTDEYLVLHDGPLLDDELGQLFDPIRARLSMVALDACFSGGFAKDMITRPGRIGFFSSEEDVLSAVASQFQAGGYLSHFIRLAVSGEADMSPADRVLTVGELSHFLYTQFGRHATDVQLQGAYQHLVVDRGAVHGDQVMWSYR